MLHLITDRGRLAPGAAAAAAFACIVEQARYAVGAAIDVIQIRERDLEARSLAILVAAVLDTTRGSRTKVVVNERLDVALATGAAGVHLRGDSFEARHVRTIAPAQFTVGRSVHSVAEARAAGPVDYVTAGTVWPTGSKPGDWPLLGIDGLRAIAREASMPVVAIGGIVPGRFADVKAAGAEGIAGIGLFVGSGTGCRARALQDIADKYRAAFGADKMRPITDTAADETR